jgi:TonB family protein
MPDRLVIRIKIPSDAQRAVPERRRRSRGVLLLIGGAVALVIGAIAIMMLRTESTPPAAPVVKVQPPPETRPSPVVESKPIEQPAPAPQVNEVVPDVPRSARQTISGTIKVIIRVIVDKDGKVVGATTDVPGPSRYFERLATEAARKWTFPPASSPEQRVVRLTFSFRRSGTTAESRPL